MKNETGVPSANSTFIRPVVPQKLMPRSSVDMTRLPLGSSGRYLSVVALPTEASRLTCEHTRVDGILSAEVYSWTTAVVHID